MSTPRVVLLPSPLLSEAVWQPVASRLRSQGWDARVGSVARPVEGPGDVLRGFLSSLPQVGDAVLVVHSNSGAYVPSLLEARAIRAVVFADAILPPPRGEIALAAAPFLPYLRSLADAHGLLPVWTSWFDERDTAGLFPDAETRATVEAEQHRLPLSYFEQRLAAPAGWDARPAAYLAFGNTYATERDDALSRGWAVSTIADAIHLHMLVEPDVVAAELARLLEDLVR